MEEHKQQLSPGGAIVVGVFCAGVGVLVILAMLGVFGPPRLTRDTPPWVGLLAGLMFVLGGLAVIVGYAVAGGAGRDGDLPPGTPFSVRFTQYLLGLGITVSLGLIATWVALGAGGRNCQVTGLMSAEADETVCRVVFGIGTLLVWAFAVVLTVISYKRMQRG